MEMDKTLNKYRKTTSFRKREKYRSLPKYPRN